MRIDNKGIKVKFNFTRNFCFIPKQELKHIKITKSKFSNGFNQFYNEAEGIMKGKNLYIFTEKSLYFLCFKITFSAEKLNT